MTFNEELFIYSSNQIPNDFIKLKDLDTLVSNTTAVENMPILIQSDMHHFGFKIHNLDFLRTKHSICQLCTPIFMKIRTITEL